MKFNKKTAFNDVRKYYYHQRHTKILKAIDKMLRAVFQCRCRRQKLTIQNFEDLVTALAASVSDSLIALHPVFVFLCEKIKTFLKMTR